jgi:hypothetical protein
VTVIVDDPPAVTEVGLNETVVPAGWPDALSETVCAEPLVTAVEIDELPLPPCWTLRLDGEAASEKSFATVPPQPVTLNAPMRVCQLKLPFALRYWFVYQNVQSSLGSTLRLV